jgi:hypothetical protein
MFSVMVKRLSAAITAADGFAVFARRLKDGMHMLKAAIIRSLAAVVTKGRHNCSHTCKQQHDSTTEATHASSSMAAQLKQRMQAAA